MEETEELTEDEILYEDHCYLINTEIAGLYEELGWGLLPDEE